MFLFHWKEESQHAILDELEWMREDRPARHASSAISAVDGSDRAGRRGRRHCCSCRRTADVDYFLKICPQRFTAAQVEELQSSVLRAYRWQYVSSGVQDRRFAAILSGMITPGQSARIGAALAPIMS